QMWCPSDEYSSPTKRINADCLSSHSSNLVPPTVSTDCAVPSTVSTDCAVPSTVSIDSAVPSTVSIDCAVFRTPFPPVFPTVSHGSPTSVVSSVHPDTPRPTSLKRPLTSSNHNYNKNGDGVCLVIQPILPYVDLVRKESTETPLCDMHRSVDEAVKSLPGVIDMNEINGLLGKKVDHMADFEDGSEVDFNAPFICEPTVKIDENVFNREKMKQKKIEELIEEMSWCEYPSPYLISSFSSSFSLFLAQMKPVDRQTLLANLRSSLLTSSSVPSTDGRE
ncbi:hypothetical protein PFISCL1PPCAC_15449, partial [Pristionchus fissidentatus]